jgi:hypothetical protein
VQTCIRNLIGDWPVKSWGRNLQPSGSAKTSLQQFREDPGSLAIELEPLRCEEAAKDLIIRFQVGERAGAGSWGLGGRKSLAKCLCSDGCMRDSQIAVPMESHTC